jgi:NADH:ubiquinone oxidoreductase subunit 3 (subunit A)
MTSSWDSYYIVFLSAIVALGIPAALWAVSFLLFPKEKVRKAKSLTPIEPIPNRTILGQRINVRFFLAANAALVLITLGLALVPCVTTLQSDHREGLLTGLISIITIAGFAVLGLLYSIRKGDMGWLSTYRTKEGP